MKGITLSVFLVLGLIGFIQGQKPNILFLFSDDHTEQAIGVYNSWLKDVVQTPNIDNLASQGMLFSKCYVTNSICGPSRAVIQTGKYSHLNGFRQNGNQFDGSQQTFPKIMQQNGYETAIIGKWHLSTEPQGFDYFSVMRGQGNYNNPSFRINEWPAETTLPGYNSDVVVDEGTDWLLNGRDESKPFMLMLQFKATHRGWVPPAKYYRMYDDIVIPEHPTLLDNFDYRGSAAFHQDMSIRYSMNRTDVRIGQGGDPRGGDPEGLGIAGSGAERDTWEEYENEVKADFAAKGHTWGNDTEARVKWMYQQYLRAYLATSTALDDNIGRVLDFLDENGLAENTVVIYTSDQGFYLGEHGWFDKRMMYEESLKTPFMVRWPGTVTPGTVNHTDLISNIDFAQTILDIAEINAPSDMQGRSLVPLFEGNTPADWRTTFYYQYWQGHTSTHQVQRHYGITTGRYKLIYFHDSDEWEFYDLRRDPDEMINQYYIPENAALIDSLKTELEDLRQELNVPDEGTFATPPQITPMQWTTQLPIVGCTDPAYQEFDPEADSLGANMCLTAAVKKPFALENQAVNFTVQGDMIVFTATETEKLVTLSIHELNGKKLATLDAESDGKVSWHRDGRRGMYLVKARVERGTRVLKLLL